MLGHILVQEGIWAVLRFKLALEAMYLFFTPGLSPKVMDRVSKVLYKICGFGDAPGMGFGSSTQTTTGLSYN
jgi:hypothetical protein